MPRTAGKTGSGRDARLAAHALLLESDLALWAGAGPARGGRRDALLGRVESLHLSLDGRAIEARVRGNGSVTARLSAWVEDQAIRFRCSCSPDGAKPCRHAVAAVEALRFPRARATERRRVPGRPGAGRGRIIQPAPPPPGFVRLGDGERAPTREERIEAAREEELAGCRHRGRHRRHDVEPLEATGPLSFEVRRARSDGEQRVTLRGTAGEFGSCTCSDFADNELGTCEHVEKVRSWRSRRKKADRRRAPTGMLSLWWHPRAWLERVPERLRELRLGVPAEVTPTLETWFEDEGWLREPPPGTQGLAWARAALDACRDAARAHALVWDLDEAVPRRLDEAATAEEAGKRLGRAGAEGSAFRDVVDGLGVRLHPYQEDGALFLARCGRAFLADDMGLGKTLQAIAAALVLRRTAGVRKTLVVCPASLKHQWSREIERACGEEARVVEGPRALRLASYADWREGFLIANYELVLRDLDAIRACAAELVVLDEAQRIKNWDTKTARAVKCLHSPHAFILTGTPLENRLLELHSLVEFLHPRALGPRWRLLPFHEVPDGRGRVMAYEGLHLLRRRMRAFFLRRERKTVLDQLPERTDHTFWTGMTPAQRRPYRRHASTVAALIANHGTLGPREIRILLQGLTAMRILCNAHAQSVWSRHEKRVGRPELPTRGEVRELWSPKLEEFARVLDDLLEESDEKIVVFSQWERMLRLAEFVSRESLGRRELRAGIFHGGLDGRARTRLLDAFCSEPDLRVLFSTDAGGLGLNLQDAASIVVNLEVPWNPAVLEQRIGRVHRLGQRRGVRVLHFVTRGAIEERVRQVVESKRALFEGLLVDEVDRVVLDERARSSFLDRVRALVGPGESTPAAR